MTRHTPKNLLLIGAFALAILTIGCGGTIDSEGDVDDATAEEVMDNGEVEATPTPSFDDTDGEAGDVVGEEEGDYFLDEEDGAYVLEEDDTDATSPSTPDAVTFGEGDGALVPADRSGRGNNNDQEAATKVVMTFVSANIGRNYNHRGKVQSTFERIRKVIGAKKGPKLIGWQEIGEGDPCGNCEYQDLQNTFSTERRWVNKRPKGVHVPNTSRGAGSPNTRAVFASPGWARVSPTRYVTVTYYPDRNVSLINTHLIAGAWGCKSETAKRRDYWHQAWKVLKQQVAREHDRGRNVIVTGDLNRPRSANRCNPAWDPTSLHRRAQIIGGHSIDYIFAVPAAGKRFALARDKQGNVRRGSIDIGIDSHDAFWVRGKFANKAKK